MKEIWFVVIPGYAGTAPRAWNTSFAQMFADHPDARQIACILKPERKKNKNGKPARP